MMVARCIAVEDISKLKTIWKRYYSHEFEFPDFTQFHMAYVITDDSNNEIVTAGGVRPIAESVILTDQDVNTRVRVRALYEMLRANISICKEYNYNQLHCFIQDEDWYSQLQHVGFKPTVGSPLVLDF